MVKMLLLQSNKKYYRHYARSIGIFHLISVHRALCSVANSTPLEKCHCTRRLILKLLLVIEVDNYSKTYLNLHVTSTAGDVQLKLYEGILLAVVPGGVVVLSKYALQKNLFPLMFLVTVTVKLYVTLSYGTNFTLTRWSEMI